MTKWIISNGGDVARKVEVVKESKKLVTVIIGLYQNTPWQKTFKRSEVFDTFEGAKSSLIELQKDKVASLRLQLEQENGRLGNLKGLKNPDDKEGAK